MKLFVLLTALVPVVFGALYCPAKDDLQVAYSSTSTPAIIDGGWTIHGGGAVCSKSSFDILNGWVSYVVDFTETPPGVNANIYSISPKFAGGASSAFDPKDYCDGNNANYCVECDWIESNGNCGGQTTLHDVEGSGSSEYCNGWGCATTYTYGSAAAATFHMNVSFDASGKWTTYRDGVVLSELAGPTPKHADWENVAKAIKDRGALVYSSQWVGWVPVAACGSSGDLSKARMSISKLKISGTVVQGPTPRTC